MAQGGVDRGSVVVLMVLPRVLFGGGGAGAVMEGVFDGPRRGCDVISIGWTGVSITWGIEGGVGGLRYYTGIPSVKFGKFKVAIIGLLTMLDGGKRKGLICTRREP